MVVVVVVLVAVYNLMRPTLCLVMMQQVGPSFIVTLFGQEGKPTHFEGSPTEVCYSWGGGGIALGFGSGVPCVVRMFHHMWSCFGRRNSS